MTTVDREPHLHPRIPIQRDEARQIAWITVGDVRFERPLPKRLLTAVEYVEYEVAFAHDVLLHAEVGPSLAGLCFVADVLQTKIVTAAAHARAAFLTRLGVKHTVLELAFNGLRDLLVLHMEYLLVVRSELEAHQKNVTELAKKIGETL